MKPAARTNTSNNGNNKRNFEQFQNQITSNVIQALKAQGAKEGTAKKSGATARDVDDDVNDEESAFSNALLDSFALSNFD